MFIITHLSRFYYMLRKTYTYTCKILTGQLYMILYVFWKLKFEKKKEKGIVILYYITNDSKPCIWDAYISLPVSLIIF